MTLMQYWQKNAMFASGVKTLATGAFLFLFSAGVLTDLRAAELAAFVFLLGVSIVLVMSGIRDLAKHYTRDQAVQPTLVKGPLGK